MLTYELKKAPGVPLYEALYRCLRQSILSGELTAGDQLPSKRALAAHLEVSKITVETAYNQLLAEGYIRSQEKVGYFVEQIVRPQQTQTIPMFETAQTENWPLDLAANGPAHFPFSVWNRLQREVMQDYGHQLLQPPPNQGYLGLRQSIARHLAQFRGMHVDPDQIILGAGTDFLYNLLIQLLGRDRIYGTEDPGYDKIRKIYSAGGVRCVPVSMDELGVVFDELENVDVLHISPSHHFPTGLVMPMSRRIELLDWAQKQSRYIIEDDYDSEFRFHAHPMPALQTLDRSGRVIYMNTFSKTLAPSIRISYMVLPKTLGAVFRQKLGFYSCTVSTFDQYTLERFLSRGHFEKHINRMRRFYKTRRDRVMDVLKSCDWSCNAQTREENAGLHFLLKIDTSLSDKDLVSRFTDAGIRVRTLSSYYSGNVPSGMDKTLVMNYSGLSEEELDRLKNVRLMD